MLFALSVAQQQLQTSDLGVILNSIYQPVLTLQKSHLMISESSRIRDCEQQERRTKAFNTPSDISADEKQDHNLLNRE